MYVDWIRMILMCIWRRMGISMTILILMRTITGIPMSISTGMDTPLFIETCLTYIRSLTNWSPMTV